MKRVGYLYEKVIAVGNLVLADKKAQRGKRRQSGVIKHNSSRGCNILLLHNMLAEERFVNSTYYTFSLFEPKERVIHRLPFYPDRIVQHAIMNILRPLFISTFVKDTYNCIPNRGIHKASYTLRKYLSDKEGTKYCLKFDVKKFYESVDHSVLKGLLRRKIKDNKLLNLLDIIIDSAPGIPLGNYLSQYFSNYYLSYFDHYAKEVLGVKYYLRYCDDIVVLGDNKEWLWSVFREMKQYLSSELKLSVKKNYQVFPVGKRGIDFVGYVHFGSKYVKLRSSIKKSFISMFRHNYNQASYNSYLGWLQHCNSYNLLNKYKHK